MKKRILALMTLAALAVPGASPAQTSGATCDRQCLKGIADTYLSAMAAHDPKKAPLAANVTIVENLKRIQPDTGLWTTTTAVPADFRIYVPDVKAQQIGLIGMIQVAGKPAELGLRLKVEGGKIVEAEHIAVYELRPNIMQNLARPRLAFSQPVAEPYRDSRGRLIAIARSYYDALDDNNGALAPFADDCDRHENGMQTARNAVPSDPNAGEMGILGALGCAAQMNTQIFRYVDKIDNRRVWIADEETGLAFGLSHFRHSMKDKEYPLLGVPSRPVAKMDFEPFDLPAAHVFKIWGGQIHEVEALGYQAAYQSATGWER